MSGRPIRLGPVFWTWGVIGTAFISFGLWFLQVVAHGTLEPGLVAWGMGLIIIAVVGRVGLTREGMFSGRILVASILAMGGLVMVSIIADLFGLSNQLSLGITGSLLVNLLYSSYEETFSLGIRSAGRAGNLPSVYIIMLDAAAFLPYHFWHYGVALETLPFIILLMGARVIFDTIGELTSHSDPAYIAHGVWNFFATVFGGG